MFLLAGALPPAYARTSDQKWFRYFRDRKVFDGFSVYMWSDIGDDKRRDTGDCAASGGRAFF